MKKFTWGHGVIVALGSFMILILGIIFFGAKILFPNGNESSDLVSENYYEDELSYQKVIDAKNNADNLLQKPQFAQLPEGIKITFPKDAVNETSKVKYHLYRTNDETKDKYGSVELSADKSFIIPKSFLEAGNYTLKVKWTLNKKDYQVDYDVVWK